MRLKITVLLVVLAALLLFPERVKAGGTDVLHYYTHDGYGLVWHSERIEWDGQAGLEARAFSLFQAMFESGRADFVPEGVRVLDAWTADGVLYIDISQEIWGYGGAYYERCLTSQIIRTARGLPGVEGVTLLIGHERLPLAEGSTINAAAEWEDMTKEGQ